MLRDPSDEIDHWLQAGPPTVVTVAPELPDALRIIERLVEAGVVVGLGHSAADAVMARAALDAGARLGTHLFNAMRPFHRRRPGLVGALLADRALTVEVIADGSHLDPLTVDLVVRAAGPERVALVSDALACAGAPPGPYPLGDQKVFYDGEHVRDADGTLAGSALLLDGCLGDVRRWLRWLLPGEVVRMATQTPAAVLGGEIAARKGRVAVGYDADLAILDPDFRVRATLVAGEIVWRSEGAR